MICNRCGNELQEGEKFCGKCGTKQKRKSKIKITVSDVINEKDVIYSNNKVAYIAKAWALQLKQRGENFAIIAFIICFLYGIVMESNVSPYDDTPYWLLFLLYGIIAVIVIIAIFNTVAFIIRMGAEVIQLLDDIKNKEKDSI